MQRAAAITARGLGLVVDDEEPTRFAVRSCLVRHGFRVLEAETAQEAIAIVRGLPRPVDVAVVRAELPGIGGRELARRITDDRGAVSIVFTSSWTARHLRDHGLLDDEQDVVPRPVTREELITAVMRLQPGAAAEASG